MSREPALITFRPGKDEHTIWRFECPNTPLQECRDDACAFHTATIFETLPDYLYFKRFPAWLTAKITGGDWPSIEIETKNFLHAICDKKTWKKRVGDAKLPRLKALCQTVVRNNILHDRHTLFKMLLQKRYDIPIAELDGIDAQLDILLE